MAIESARLMPVSVPGVPVRIGVLAHHRSGAEADEIEAVPPGKFDTGRGVRRVPQRRIRLLQRMQFDRDVLVTVVRSLEVQPRLRQPRKQDRERLIEDRARIRRIDPEIAQLIGRDAAADAEFQTTA
jgi:hypothetical protein